MAFAALIQHKTQQQTTTHNPHATVTLVACGPAYASLCHTHGVFYHTTGWEASQNKYLLRELLIHQELSACHHPHIVELKEVFLTPVYLAAVMEHVEGQDLQEFLSVTGGRWVRV